MADELQALFNRINRDAITKGEGEREKIISAARQEAQQIVAAAKEEAQQIVAEAHSQAETTRRKSEEALRQSGREIMLEVRGELERRVAGAVSTLMKAQLHGENLGQVVTTLCAGYLAKAGTESAIEVLLPEADLQVVAETVKAQLAAELQQNVSLAPSRHLAGGFQLSFKGQDVVYDFSDEALTEAFAAHLSPALGEIISRQK